MDGGNPTHKLDSQPPAQPTPPRAFLPYELPTPIPGPYGTSRKLPDPRTPLPGHRPCGLPGTPVTLPAQHVPQDTITYCTATAQSAISDPHAVRYGSIPNGYSTTMSPPNEAQFPTPPLPQTPHYGQPPPMAPYSNGPCVAQYDAGAARIWRKQVRATQACNHCRSRKQKCDEARPCQFCRENNFNCEYKDVPPPKQDRSIMRLQDSVNSISHTLKSLVDNFNVWKQYVDDTLAQPQLAANTPPAFDHASPQQAFSGQNSATLAQSSIAIKQESFYTLLAQPATPANSVATTSTQVAQDPIIVEERPGLKPDHRTPAHRLFIEWPTMDKFTDGIPCLKSLSEAGHRVDQYPMLMEQDRGVLRVWGYGEGNDDNPSILSTKEDLWGCPPDYSSISPNTTSNHIGGLGPDGTPDFQSAVLYELTNSYMENIHNLHPFLSPATLQKMMQEFSELYSPDCQNNTTSRSSGVFERSPHNAVILLVLALGKVCKHEGVLPSPQSKTRNIDRLPGMAYYAYATDILGNQIGGNTEVHAQASILAALYLGQFGRVLESWSSINQACRICLVLVKQEGKKLLRPKVTENADGVQEEPEYQPNKPEECDRLNLIKCLYWTCVQMESDIVAEFSELQPSAITDYQHNISYPSSVYESFGELPLRHKATKQEWTIFLYSSQIHLRVLLNGVHNNLYSPRHGYDDIDQSCEAAQFQATLLAQWRQMLPEPLAWNDTDPPSTNIDIARMRAKYYGANYIVLRPLLFKAIHAMNGNTSSIDQENILPYAQTCVQSAIQSTIAFDRIGAKDETPYMNYESQRTTRLIVPNIFGTLHAQFGNMLVLTVVYTSAMPLGSNRLTKETVSALFKRTLNILEEHGANSPVLHLDHEILTKLAQKYDIPIAC